MPGSALINNTIDRTRHTVLVVDDNPATRYSTSRVIRAAGFKTLEAESGQDAIDKSSQDISAVVLDVHLPDLDGFEVCRAIRSKPLHSTLPIIHLSAHYVTVEDQVSGLDSGADSYLVHPVEPTVLVATLQALVRARMAELELRQSDLKFRAVYDQAPCPIVLIDGKGNFVDVNPAMSQLAGAKREDLIGTPFASYSKIAWSDSSQQNVMEQIRDKRPISATIDASEARQKTVHLVWTVSADIDHDLYIGIAQDMTEHVELEKRRHELLEREQAARLTAERHNQTKDNFIAVLSHELRTPLNAIVGWLDILMRRGGPAETVNALKVIERNVAAQAGILSDILDVSRINAGKLELERGWEYPRPLISKSLESLRPSLDRKSLTVDVAWDGADEQVWVDPNRLRQIFINLMTNAMKFSNQGGAIRVALKHDGPYLVMSVQDFGLGIAPEFLPHVFDRFSQSDDVGNWLHGGLGLGLAIVKQLTELHGGTATAFSEGEGRGATFTVMLQATPPALSSTSDEKSANEADRIAALDGVPFSGNDLAGVCVLVIEDDADSIDALTIAFRDSGADVLTARDFESATVAMNKRAPDVVVSDIGLPGRDGYELIESIRQRESKTGRKRTPAIALTAFARPEDKGKALSAGFDTHLSKPLQPHKVVGAVRKLIAT